MTSKRGLTAEQKVVIVMTHMNQISTKLFEEYKLRQLTFKNRIFMAPMCQYSAHEGKLQSWHHTHYITRAVGGCGLVMIEATAIAPEGRISAADLGIWSDEQARAYESLNKEIHTFGCRSAIQLAHAGRKGTTGEIIAPSHLAYAEGSQTPKAMTYTELNRVLDQFGEATKRSVVAGFDLVEIHMAHGYLLHEFLSPLSNIRQDEFGGSLENRMKFPLLVAERVRSLWPQHLPVFVRISATDWADGGWDLAQSVIFCEKLKRAGIDLIDVSSGGLVPYQQISPTPGYQTPFSEEIKRKAHILIGVVGLITQGQQAEDILKQDQADVIFLGRELLRNPYWPLAEAHKMNAKIDWPQQYLRGVW